MKCAPTRTPDECRYRRAAEKSTSRSATSAFVPKVRRSTCGRSAVSRQLCRRSAHAAGSRGPDFGGHRRHHSGRRLGRPHGRLSSDAGRRHQFPQRGSPRATSAGCGTGTAIPGHPVRQRVLLLFAAPRRDGFHAVEEIRRRLGDLRVLPEPLRRRFGFCRQGAVPHADQPLRWDEKIKRWRVGTNRGDDIRARFVIMACGVLNMPKLPGIPGIDQFKGKIFHTARWDYDYTGGSYRQVRCSTNWPTSAWRSSAPARPPSRRCPILASTPSNSMSSSARLRAWMSAPIRPPIPSG